VERSAPEGTGSDLCGWRRSPTVHRGRCLPPVTAIRTTIQKARVSRSKPDRGIVHTAVEVLNQRREPVLAMTAINILLRHAPQR